jgi:hypothetical protein
MKKSEFKALVKEAMMEILPDLMEIMAENLNESYKPQTVRQTPDLSLIRNQFKSGVSGEKGYDDMPSAPRTPPPQTETAVIGGEQYTSGKGIMEWFGEVAVAKPMTEFKHSATQMNDYMEKKFGV